MASRRHCFGRLLLLSTRAACLLSVLWPQWAAAQMMATSAELVAPRAPAEQSELLSHEPMGGSGVTSSPPPSFVEENWRWQILPNGLMYPAYLAGVKESRMGVQWVQVNGHGWLADATLGGHVGLVRYGNEAKLLPEGWQLDVEGAAFPRLDVEPERELRMADFRVGLPLTFRHGPWETKFGYYHLSAHLGDHFALSHPSFPRLNYIRDCAVFGVALRPWRDLRCYWEVGYGVSTSADAMPWELQFGTEYSPIEPSGARGAPFVAVNSHLRQDNDFSGNVCMQTGWQWRAETGHLMRVGVQYFNGMSEEYQTFSTFEEQVGVGLWYDF